MRVGVTSFCTFPLRRNDDDVNGLSDTRRPESIPRVPTRLFYTLHMMRQTRDILLHHIAYQDMLLAEQEELMRKMYGQLQRTTNNYINALSTIYNTNDQQSGEVRKE